MTDLLRVAICENSPEDAAVLRYIIGRSGIPSMVYTFNNGKAFLDSFIIGQYDVIFLDVHLEDISGIDVGKMIRKTDTQVILIFATKSKTHALLAYRLDALKYLEKPLDDKKVRDALSLSLQIVKKQEICTVIVKKERTDIPYREIYYVEVVDHTCLIHTSNTILETNASMKDLTLLLPPQRFLQCHRSFMVNLEHVQRIDRDFLMENGDIVYIRGKDLKKMKEKYREYLAQAKKNRQKNLIF